MNRRDGFREDLPLGMAAVREKSGKEAEGRRTKRINRETGTRGRWAIRIPKPDDISVYRLIEEHISRREFSGK